MKEYVFRAEVSTANQFEQALAIDDFQYIYVPMDLLTAQTPDKFRIIAVPPAFLGDCEKAVAKKLLELKSNGFEHVLSHTTGHLELINSLKMKAHGGFRMNIENSLMEGFLERNGLVDTTLSIELTKAQSEAIKCNVPRGAIAYGKLPLMMTRRCPINDGKPCNTAEKCGKKITDRKGNEFSVLCSNTVEILNPDTLFLSDKLSDFAYFDFLTLRFTDENDIGRILEMYQNNIKPDGKLTRGLYYRGTE